MNEERLDKLIENGIKSALMEVDFRHPVMDRILSYKIEKTRKPKFLIIFMYLYTLFASLISLFFLYKLSPFSTPLFKQLFPCFSLLGKGFIGIFIFIPTFLLFMGFYYWQELHQTRKKNEENLGRVR